MDTRGYIRAKGDSSILAKVVRLLSRLEECHDHRKVGDATDLCFMTSVEQQDATGYTEKSFVVLDGDPGAQLA
jgi:hypothetical protein